jgi:hypothetical protein
MLTNLGPVPLASRFGDLTLKALWGPAVLSGLAGEQTIGVATLEGSLYLTHTSHTPPDGLLAAMHRVLVEAGIDSVKKSFHRRISAPPRLARGDKLTSIFPPPKGGGRCAHLMHRRLKP